MTTVLFFKANWCGPCKKINPQFDLFMKDYDIEIRKIDIDDHPELAKMYHIKAVPTFVLLYHGKFKKINSLDELKKVLKKIDFKKME